MDRIIADSVRARIEELERSLVRCRETVHSQIVKINQLSDLVRYYQDREKRLCRILDEKKGVK